MSNNINTTRHIMFVSQRLIFTMLVVLLSVILSAQVGCTDSQATNYDPSALTNDGSCEYPYTLQDPDFLYNLPNNNPNLDEFSGHDYWEGNGVWGIVDGAGTHAIYHLNETGAVIQTITIENAENIDWEDIAVGDDFIYVGDFGNNSSGDRTDLKIYKVAKNEITSDEFLSVQAEIISFYYPEQGEPQFTSFNETEWDCEALLWVNGDLHLFTKNWLNYTTSHYKLPDTPGDYAAELMEVLDCEGTITAADIKDGKVVLLGYTESFENFMYLLWGYPSDMFFSGNKRRVELGLALSNGQTEGICFTSSGEGLISSELVEVGGILTIPAKMMHFTVEDYTTSVEELNNEIVNLFWPTKTTGILHTNLKTGTVIQVYSVLGKEVLSTSINNSELDLSNLDNGYYILLLSDSEEGRYQRILISK